MCKVLNSATDEAVLCMGIPQPILTLAKEYGKLFYTEAFVEDVETLYKLCDDMVCIPDYEKQIKQRIVTEKHKPETKEKPETLKDKTQRLARENQKLRQRKKCRKCKEVELCSDGVTFLPCGHFITCEACSETYERCPACGKYIMGTVKTYLS